jgi:tetratricopeptide repeat protein
VRGAAWCLCVAGLLAGVRPPRARAQETDPAGPVASDGGERPWTEGTAAEGQESARPLFRAGNERFEQGQYARALELYRQAVASWDHPAIRYNMAVALIQLDQPLAAYHELERALRHGSAPHQPGKYEQALTYRKLLLGQLARLEIVCREPDARVLVDAEPVMVGPGQTTVVLAPGAHVLLASKPGYLTTSRALSLVAGRVTAEDIDLVPLPRPSRVDRRWAAWKPWAVIAGGAALGLLAIPFQRDAASRFEDYDRAVGTACPRGCNPAALPDSVRGIRSLAQVENTTAAGLFATGAVAALAGLAMVAWNQPRVVPVEPPPRRLAVVPAAGERGSLFLTLVGAFP